MEERLVVQLEEFIITSVDLNTLHKMILGIEIHIYNQNVGSQLIINFYQINVTKIEIIEKTAYRNFN